MEMKAKPTKITRLDKLDNYGNSTFIIEFDDGQKGFYTSKSAEQTKFIVGNVADYEIETKQGSKGPYNKITVPVPAFMKPGSKPVQDPKTQMISFTASYIKDLVVADKVKMDDFEKQFNRIYSLMISKL